MIYIGLYLLGVATGVAVYRLGFGLGVRITYQIQEKVPLIEESHTSQESTEDYGPE